jgi:heat shock protein HtpX
MTTVVEPPLAGRPCPACRAALVTVRNAVPWCAVCEWNLIAYDPDRREPETGVRWLDRRLHRLACRLNAAQFARLAGAEVTLPGWNGSRIVLVVAGVVFAPMIVASFATGVYRPSRGGSIRCR